MADLFDPVRPYQRRPERGSGRPEGGRYRIPGADGPWTGPVVPAVTTFLRCFAGHGGQTGLHIWMEQLAYLEGYEHGVQAEDPMCWVDEETGKRKTRGKLAPTAEKNRAGAVGAQVHDAIEALLQGEPDEVVDGIRQDLGTAKNIAQAQNAWRGFQRWVTEVWTPLHADGWRIIATEVPVVHPTKRYGGTLDAMAKKPDGELCVLDWKTSSSLYTSMVYQVAAYALAWEAERGDDPPVSDALICRFDKDVPEGWYESYRPAHTDWVRARRIAMSLRAIDEADHELSKTMRAQRTRPGKKTR